MVTNKIYLVDTLLIVGTLLAIIVALGYSTPLVISPTSKNNNITQTDILFTLEKSNNLFIDTNIEFSNAKAYLMTNGLELEFMPGTYYLKTGKDSFSQIITLTIESPIVLELKETKDGFDIVNSGDKPLNVELHDTKKVIDNMQLTPSKLEGGGKKK